MIYALYARTAPNKVWRLIKTWEKVFFLTEEAVINEFSKTKIEEIRSRGYPDPEVMIKAFKATTKPPNRICVPYGKRKKQEQSAT